MSFQILINHTNFWAIGVTMYMIVHAVLISYNKWFILRSERFIWNMVLVSACTETLFICNHNNTVFATLFVLLTQNNKPNVIYVPFITFSRKLEFNTNYIYSLCKKTQNECHDNSKQLPKTCFGTESDIHFTNSTHNYQLIIFGENKKTQTTFSNKIKITTSYQNNKRKNDAEKYD